MTVKELKEALAALDPRADDLEFRVWLPGSEIYLSTPGFNAPVPFFRNGHVMIEGNLTKDSALARD